MKPDFPQTFYAGDQAGAARAIVTRLMRKDILSRSEWRTLSPEEPTFSSRISQAVPRRAFRLFHVLWNPRKGSESLPHAALPRRQVQRPRLYCCLSARDAAAITSRPSRCCPI